MTRTTRSQQRRPLEKQWPVNTDNYDRTPRLSTAEQAALDQYLSMDKNQQSLAHLPFALSRLVRPLTDVLAVTNAPSRSQHLTVLLLFREMYTRRTPFWAWEMSVWVEILNKEFPAGFHGSTHFRQHLMAIAYLLCGFNEFPSLGKVLYYPFAIKVFGQEVVGNSVQCVRHELMKWGHGQDTLFHLPHVMSEILVRNRSPYLEDLSYEFLNQLRPTNGSSHLKGQLAMISRALVSLGMLERPLLLKTQEVKQIGHEGAIANVAEEWATYCHRWYTTSTYSPRTRRAMYYRMMRIGRWVTAVHPDMTSPGSWTREMAAECVAAIDRMKVGEWALAIKTSIAKRGLELSPRAKVSLLAAMRTFFRDCQEWNWIPRHFDARRCFSVPRSLKMLIAPDPRIIQEDIWAKLLWSGLNLTDNDLPQIGTRYPLELIRAVAITWLFAGLRSDELLRLRLGCVRWQKEDVPIAATNEILAREAVCWLDVPTHKTGTAFTKAVDKVVGEAIEAWEHVRPVQPMSVDAKTSEVVHYLFMFRGRRVGKLYLNRYLIPLLCRKAGVPESDARGNITSHRARSTIATQLYNAKEPLTLFELQEWLGHLSPATTQHYAKITPTKLAKAYEKAGYFDRNMRTIEVLIDQEAVKSGAAANGTPWEFYDLGHGYCSYEFFEQCPHRMACAKCAFYIPKGSTQAQLLEGKTNLQRMLQEIPLSEEERAAVEDGIAAMEKLCDQLADVPTPAGPTPSQLKISSQGGQAMIPLEKIHRRK